MRLPARLLAAASLFLASAASAETLYFSAIPDEDATALTARFSRVADYLSGELGVDVEFVPVKSYPAPSPPSPTTRCSWPGSGA